MIKVTKDNIVELIKSGTTIIQFSASWCGPCRQLTPIMEQMANDYEGKASVGKVDIDEEQELAVEFGVRSIPTTIIFKDGKAVDTIMGLETKANLIKKINATI